MTAVTAPNVRRRVLFLVPSLRRAGAETQVVDLVNALDSTRFEKHLAFFESQADQLARVDVSTVRVHRLSRHRKLDLKLVAELAELIDREGIELVHCTLQIALFMAMLARWKTRTRPRIIVTVHTTVNRSMRDEFFDRVVYRAMIGRCDRVVFVCRAQAEYWIGRFPELRELSTVVYNGVDPAIFDPDGARDSARDIRARLGIQPGQCVITCIAGLRSEKGHELLVRAFAGVAGTPRLLLAGDGPERQRVEDLAQALGVKDRVTLLGEVSDVRGVIAASDVTVLASNSETFSMAMLESMAMGVPVVATDVGGLGEAISIGRTGDLVPPRDADRLRDALQRMIDHEPERQLMGRSARELVRTKFSQRAMAEATATVLSSVLDGSHATTSGTESAA